MQELRDPHLALTGLEPVAEPGLRANREAQVSAALSITTPATTKPIATSRAGPAGSPAASIPIPTAPTAPTPVKIT